MRVLASWCAALLVLGLGPFAAAQPGAELPADAEPGVEGPAGSPVEAPADPPPGDPPPADPPPAGPADEPPADGPDESPDQPPWEDEQQPPWPEDEYSTFSTDEPVKPPSDAPEEERDCCSWSLRYDPFDLLFRRVTVEGEIKIWGPLTIQLAPAWVFDSPSENLSEMGFDVAADLVWYIQGHALEGFWLKAHVEYEWFESTLTREIGGAAAGIPDVSCDEDSEPGTCTKTVNSLILGLMVGTSAVFGGDGGFGISGGIGLGVALADSVDLAVHPDPETAVPGEEGLGTAYYDGADRLRLLGSLGVGITF